MELSIKKLVIQFLWVAFVMAGCSFEGMSADKVYRGLVEDIKTIESLPADISIEEKLTIYSRAEHKINRLRTRYSSTSKGEEVRGNPVLAGSLSIEEIINETQSVKEAANRQLPEDRVELIMIKANSDPEVRNDSLEHHGISMARKGDIAMAEEIIPLLLNSLSIGIVQLEVAKAYEQQGNIQEAKNFSLEASDNVNSYDFDEDVCSNVGCEGEEPRKMLVQTEIRRLRTSLYSR